MVWAWQNHLYSAGLASLSLFNHIFVLNLWPSQRLHLNADLDHPLLKTQIRNYDNNSINNCLKMTMPTVPSSTGVLKKDTKVPGLASLLTSAGSGSDECSLCGKIFDIGGACRSLPCIDKQCEPCAQMWRILSSPTCPACYGEFTVCPKIGEGRAHIGNSTLQQPSPSNSHMKSPLSFQDRYVAFYGGDGGSDDDTISDPGSSMRDESSELNDEDLREILILANDRAGTNFSVSEVEAELPLTVLRSGTKSQLTAALTQFCYLKASENDKDDTGEDDAEHDGKTAEEYSFRCGHCRRPFKTQGSLGQHLVRHTLARRTCSICGKVLADAKSRLSHEKRHRETASERGERLRKAKISRDRHNAKQKLRESICTKS